MERCSFSTDRYLHASIVVVIFNVNLLLIFDEQDRWKQSLTPFENKWRLFTVL